MTIPISLRTLLCVVLSLGALVFSGIRAEAATWYVSRLAKDDALAGTNWASAKRTIQAAIDLAADGDLVLVTNGVYSTMGTNGNFASGMTNRVMIERAIRVQSVNGPSVTSIVGAKDPSGTNGDLAIRCAHVGGGAVLSGFTLTNGATRRSDSVGHYADREKCGGGVLNMGTVENCIITGNSGVMAAGAFGDDGGLSLFTHCIFSNNVAMDFYDNDARTWFVGAGAAYLLSGSVDNSLVVSNRGNLGAIYGGAVSSSTVVRNFGTNSAVANSSVYNCIVYYNGGNTRQIDTNSVVSFTCTTPVTAGVSNITNAPLFVSTNTLDFHLGPFSPCADAGDGFPGNTDLDGQPRIYHARVDLGCYERQLAGDFNNDGVVNAADLNTVLTNYSNPVDAMSVNMVLSNYFPNKLLLAMTNVAGVGGSNVTFALTNSNAGAYNVQYSTNLSQTNWQTLGSAVPRYQFTDTNAGAGPLRYYRLSLP